jgi:16S rRNA (guanine966-N2)-methyltransferase
MSIQIFAGRAKGLSLFLPKQEIRPTAVTLRRKIFDRFQDMQDFIFVDLCSGTGAMGIEAFSRGCEEVILVEKDRNVYLTLTKNVQLVSARIAEAQTQIETVKTDAIEYIQKKLNYLQSRAKQNNKILFLYFDPPYELTAIYDAYLDWLKTQAFDNIYLAIEADTQKSFSPERIEQIFPSGKTYWQGSHFIYLIEPK